MPEAGFHDAAAAGPTQLYRVPRDAALALLNSDATLTRKAGSFLGQTAVDPAPLTAAQSKWLASLLERAGLPPLEEGGTL